MGKKTRGIAARYVIICASVMTFLCATGGGLAQGANPQVVLQTSLGQIKLELYANKAPITVRNFLRYVDEHFYDGTIFHRVIPGFMIQGGGFTREMRQKSTHDPIKNEAGLKNLRGTIAMARTGVVDSATSQFFINTVDNLSLDHKNDTPGGFGYAVFGKVIDGMETAGKIAKVKTRATQYSEGQPVTGVVILSAARAKPAL